MKKSYLLLIAFFISQSFQAQNIIPLKIDSSYTYEWGIVPVVDTLGMGIDTFTSESIVAYSYDTYDSLIQVRRPITRLNWEYLVDTTYIDFELLINGTWFPQSKAIISYANGKATAQLSQIYLNDSWTNNTLFLYTRNAAQQLTQELQQSWTNNTWRNYSKTETAYYPNGLKSEQKVYNFGTNNQWNYSTGRFYEYDLNNNLTQVQYVNPSATGYYTIQINQIYGTDNLIDTILKCIYETPTDIICDPTDMTTYTYFMDRTEQKTFHYAFNTWILNEKTVSYDGPGVYSNRPDSIYYYRQESLGQSYFLTGKRYLQYQELTNDSIYFREEKYTYFGEPIGWARTLLNEEWYHLKTVAVNTPTETAQNVHTAPNPCRPGTPLNISAGNADEILVFDKLGRLVASQRTTDSNVIQAPMKQGVYTLVLMKNGKLVGRAKQVVME